MLEEINRNQWTPFFTEFNGRNEMRPTRLEVMSNAGWENWTPAPETDFWLESGLPFLGLSLDKEGPSAPRIEIMLGGEPSDHLTRTVTRARRVRRTLDPDGRESELEIEDQDGTVTILHF